MNQTENISDAAKRKQITVRGLSGLDNIGNTCYMNSVLQCLSNCDLFRDYLFNATFVKTLINKCASQNENEIKLNLHYLGIPIRPSRFLRRGRKLSYDLERETV